MMGCQPQSSSRHPSRSNARYSQASLTDLQETVSVSHPVDSHPQYPVHSSSPVPTSIARLPGSEALSQQRPSRPDLTAPAAYYPALATEGRDSRPGFHYYPPSDSGVQHQQQFVPPSDCVTSHHQHLTVSGSPQFAWRSDTASAQHKGASSSGHQPQFVPPEQADASPGQQFAPPVKTVVSQYQPDRNHHHHLRPAETSQKPLVSRPAETVTSQQYFVDSKEQRQQLLGQPTVCSLHPPPSFATRSTDSSPTTAADSSAVYPHFGQKSPAVSAVPPSSQQQLGQCDKSSPGQQLPSPTIYSTTMLDKKPTLQIVTTDHSPVSPGSSAGSPRFIFPDMQASSSSGHLGSDSGSSPFMSPVKREVKLEGQQERRRILSGDTDPSDTVVDSETSSSVLEDSSSSREQSPFSAMAESLSLRSPSDHCLSPVSKKALQHHIFTAAPEEEEQGEDDRGGVHLSAASQPDTEFHPSKFKKRLHERYVLSLKDAPGRSQRVKEEAVEKGECAEGESHSDSKRPLSKIEIVDSPGHTDSPMPKSPRRSSSDTDMVHTESTEMGASSADEGDVFMEPTMRVRTKHKPPSLHQREPLDLSRGPFYPGFRSSSGSSPLIDPEHLSPASKIFSPVFRSPHRLPYSPHGLMSPQSQSPLCSVPEGGRIFNFNVPSPLEGPHSDSDLISPSPMSPRIFTFPPQGTILNPMSEVNRLAVSPRAPYTPPPSFMRGKHAGGVLDPKWADQQSFYSKRSLSESDMTYLCPVCGQVFPTNDNLAKHMTKHLPTETVRAGDNNKVHYCKVCNRSFSRSDMLTRHMRLHTGLKPYECVECGQVFSRSDHLNTHRRTHTGEKPYRCPHCPYAACRRDMITRHMRTHAKRTSRRTRYLSVPDDSDTHKPSGSISSTDTVDSQDYSTSVHTCSVSSVDSVESESIHSSHPSYLGASVDSLLSPGPHSSPPSRKPSEELEEGMQGEVGHDKGSHYDRFMHYRKARNWSTTSLESVDSEEALLIREALVDDAFHDTEPRLAGPPGEDGGKEDVGRAVSSSPKDMVGLEAKTLQKCFISSQPPGSSSS